MEPVMLAVAFAALCRASLCSRQWRLLSLCLMTLISMMTAYPAQDWTLSVANITKQHSPEQVPRYTALTTALPSSSFKTLSQSRDIYKLHTISLKSEPPKTSKIYSHIENTVSGSEMTPSRGHVSGLEPLSGPAVKSDEGAEISSAFSSMLLQDVKPPVPQKWPTASGSGTLPSFSIAASNISPTPLLPTGLDSSVEPPVHSPELQGKAVNNNDTASSEPIEPFYNLHPSHDWNFQNDAQSDAHLVNPSFAVFENHHVTSPSIEPSMGPPKDFFPMNTMDLDYGSGDYSETVSYMGTEENDYSLVTNLPTDMYDFEGSNLENYDTSFPTRVMIHLSTRHPSPRPTSVSPDIATSTYDTFSVTKHLSSSLSLADTVLTRQLSKLQSIVTSKPFAVARPSMLTSIPIDSPSSTLSPTAVQPLSVLPTVSASLHQSRVVNDTTESDSNWPENVTIEPSDVLLPDMNSLEYYNIQLAKSNESLPEQRGKQSPSKYFSLIPPSPTTTYAVPSSHMLTVLYEEDLHSEDSNVWPEESSTDVSGFALFNTTILDHSEVQPSLTNATPPFLNSTVLPTPSVDFTSSQWNPEWINTESASTRVRSSNSLSVFRPPSVSEEPDVRLSAASDIQRIISSTVLETVLPTPTFISHVFTNTLSSSSLPTESTFNSTSFFFVTEMADQGVTEAMPESSFSEGTDVERTTVSKPARPSMSILDNETAMVTSSNFPTSTSGSSETVNATLFPKTTSVTGQTTTTQTTTAGEYFCSITTKPETYLVRVGFPPGSSAGYAKAKVQEILKAEFNRSVELQVVKAPPDFVFWALSGPLVYTAVAVMNSLRRSLHASESILSVAPISPVPGPQYHIHSVLQFVPSHIDIHVCTFIEHIEKGLTFAFAEVRRRSKDSTNFTVHILNITMSPAAWTQRQPRGPVDIIFVVRDSEGLLLGAEVSSLLRQLSVVEFSYYLGYPVQQVAEPFHYPELNMTQLLRSSWVKTVLLGVVEHHVSERIFQAKMERRLALLLGEGLAAGRRLKRATSVGNNSLQIVQTTRLDGPDNPLEMIYFVEGSNGERLPAVTTSNMLNRLDVQHAAIVLGYRIQGTLAQPVEKQASVPLETENANTWIIVAVVVPVLVVVIIITILYWKLCRTDKLEFQPDTVNAVQQRQKLQAPSVKGFDFAKLHLGQHSKDDLMVIQEPLPLPAPTKELSASENAEASTPKSRGSSTKASRTSQHRRAQISPSDGDSVGSEPFSERESPKENLRQTRPSSDSKQSRKMATNGLNGPPPPRGVDEQVSSASIFEHVDRMSRSADATNKRFSSKIQLIAMQPMPALPLPSAPTVDKAAENAKLTKEIQVALRQKSEIEHHRNKIRLRAKRKGHYDFPAMDDLLDNMGDAKEQDCIYQKAQMQIDKILDSESRSPPFYTDPRKSGREKRSPRIKKKQQLNGELTGADRDRLIPSDSDAMYKKYPGVNNIAFVSDPDQGSEVHSPSPTDDVFLGSGSPTAGHVAPPPPYLPLQPSIEEARQQMHSLLDDAFALVSPSSQGPNAGITLPGHGVRGGQTSPSSPPSRGPRPCGLSYPPLSPFSGRYPEVALPLSTVQGLLHRQGLGSGYTQGDGVVGEQLQSEMLYSSRGGYVEELPSSVRPRPVGGTTGAQLHHFSQVSVLGQGNEGRQPDALNLGPYEEDFRPANRDPNSRNGLREPFAPSAHLNTVGLGYPPSAPPEEPVPPSHSSSSLIKAIREELMRLSQKQATPLGYHS